MGFIADLLLAVRKKKNEDLVELIEARLALAALTRKWNRMVDRINAKGGEDFLDRGVLPEDAPTLLAPEDIDRLLQLCHPDKHGGKKSAQDMTAKLLGMRKR